MKHEAAKVVFYFNGAVVDGAAAVVQGVYVRERVEYPYAFTCSFTCKLLEPRHVLPKDCHDE